MLTWTRMCPPPGDFGVARLAVLGVVAAYGGKMPAVDKRHHRQGMSRLPSDTVRTLVCVGLLCERRVFVELAGKGWATLRAAKHNWAESGKPHPMAAPFEGWSASHEVSGAEYDADGKMAREEVLMGKRTVRVDVDEVVIVTENPGGVPGGRCSQCGALGWIDGKYGYAYGTDVMRNRLIHKKSCVMNRYAATKATD